MAAARRAHTEAQKAVISLATIAERGAFSPDDPIVVQRIAAQRTRQQTLTTEIDSIERQLSISKRTITSEMIGRLGAVLSVQLREGAANFRRAYVALLIDKVELSRDKSGSAAPAPLLNMP